MPVLTGLSGTDGEARECVFVRSISATLKVLRSRLSAVAAGDNGAFNVWRDDDGNYRCQYERYQKTIDLQIFPSLKEIKPLIKVWLEKIK